MQCKLILLSYFIYREFPLLTESPDQILSLKSLLIDADHYWNIIEGHIIRENGPTAMNSKIGYLLSGPPSPQQTSAMNISNVTIQHIDTEGGDLQKF